MSVGLKNLLKLPEPPSVEANDLTEQFDRDFRERMAGLNRNLQSAVVQASSKEIQPIGAQREKLYAAFQKVRIDAVKADPAKAQPLMQKVISAVELVDGQASQLAAGSQGGRDEWLTRESDFADKMLQIGELEEAQHPKAPAFRKIGDAIRQRANDRDFRDAVAALDQLGPKLEQVVAQLPVPLEGAPSPESVEPRDGGADEPVSGDDQKRLIELVAEILAEQAGVDLEELGGLDELLKDGDFLDKVISIVEGISPGAIVKDAVKEAIKQAAQTLKDLINKAIDGIKKLLEKRRIPKVCLVAVTNNTNVPLKLADEPKFNLGAGAWVSGKEPSVTIAPGETDTFEAKSSTANPVRGVRVTMVYEFDEAPDDGRRPDVKWGIGFINPRDAKIDAKSKVGGKEKELYADSPVKSNEKGHTAAFAFQLNLASDEDPSEPEVPEIPDDDGGGDNGGGDNGGGADTPVVDAQASCLITVVNNSSAELELRSQENELGDFMTSFPPTLAAGASAQIVMVETPDSDDSGVKGYAEWAIEGGQGRWRIDWHNPEGEKNDAGSNLSGGAEKSFHGLDQMGQGDENVPVTFTLSGEGQPVEPPVTPPETDDKRQVLTILVKDKATGDTVEAASVTVGDQTDATSANGLATVELPVGDHAYQATHPDYKTASGQVPIVEGDNPELVIELTADSAPREGLTILVRDKASGDAIEGASVTVGDQSDTTSALGLATVELPPGDHPWKVTADDYDPADGSREIIAGDNEELIVELTKGGECEPAVITVMVVDDASGQIVSDAAVTIGAKSEQTSAMGIATISLDEPGTYDYEASADAYPNAETGTVDVKAGDDNELLIRMKGDAQTTTVTFHVTDEETGEPVEGATVTFGGTPGQTAADGTLSFDMAKESDDYTVAKAGYEGATGAVQGKPGGHVDEQVALEKEPEFVPPPESDQPTLRKGSESADGWVEYLQSLLNAYLKSIPEIGHSGVDVSGAFDQQTHDAVVAFQEYHKPPVLSPKMLVDGIVGNETWSILRKGPREAVGVRNRPDESGVEARWATEDSRVVEYVTGADEVQMKAYSVGDAPIDDTEVTAKVVGKPSGKQIVFDAAIGAPTGPAPSGAGHAHTFRIPNVSTTFPGDTTLEVHAYFPQDLGGDSWAGEVALDGGAGGENPGGGSGGGSGGGGGGGGTGGGGTAGGGTSATEGTLNVFVHDGNQNGVEGAIVSISPNVEKPQVTDANGEATFTDLPFGNYQLDAISADGGLQSTLAVEHEDADATGAWYMDLGGKYVPPAVEITVFDADGKTVVGAKVKFANGAKVFAEVPTKSDGSALVTLTGEQAARPVTISAEKEGRRWESQTLSSSELAASETHYVVFDEVAESGDDE